MSNDRKTPLPPLPGLPPMPQALPATPTPAVKPAPATQSPRVAPATPSSRVAPAHAPSAKRTAAPATSGATSSLSAEILAEILRLRGEPPPERADGPRTVATVKGPMQLSPVVDSFTLVKWKDGVEHAIGEEAVMFGSSEITGRLAKNYDGPLFAIASTDSQYFFVVRVGDTTADPRVHRLDHDGSDDLDMARGQPLSRFLAKVTSAMTRPRTSKGGGKNATLEELRTAILTNDFRKARDLVKADGALATRDLDASGFTALHLAAARGNFADIVRLLLSAGADPNRATRAATKLAKDAVEALPHLGKTIAAGATPMHLALAALALPAEIQETVQALLAGGADVNLADGRGISPLRRIAQSCDRRLTPIARVLLAAGADPNAIGTDSNGSSPLLEASLDDELSRLLLDAGADPNRVTRSQYSGKKLVNGITAMHLAAARGDVAALKAMIAKGGDVNVAAADGTLPLEIANAEAAEFLRQVGARSR